MQKDREVKGYKGFHMIRDTLDCRGYKFEIGLWYTEKGAKICKYGFHYCNELKHVFAYYKPSPCSVYGEIIASGDIHTKYDKSCSSKIKVIKLLDGIVDGHYFKKGKLHRDDGPARIDNHGIKYWYQNGIKHRVDCPAVEHINGNGDWYQNGMLHRDDGPARIDNRGIKHWYQNGVRHRVDGPAVEHINGNGDWYQNGMLHRVDGPALIRFGNKYWYRFGLKHREDGPAVEYSNGMMEYFLYGKKVDEIDVMGENPINPLRRSERLRLKNLKKA